MDEITEREQVVLHVLHDADDDALPTSDILDAAGQYDTDLDHSRQVTRVFDDLEERGLITTRRGEGRDPLAPPRLASLTPAGERKAEQVTVTPLEVDDLDDLEDELWRLREELDELSRETPRHGDIQDLQERIEEVDERVDGVARRVADFRERVGDVEERIEDTRQTLADGLEGQHDILDYYDVRIEDVEEQVASLEDQLGNAGEVATSLDVDTLAEAVSENRSYIVDIWEHLWGNSSRTSAGDDA